VRTSVATLLVLFSLLAGVAEAGIGRVTTVQMPDGMRVEDTAGADLNGDGEPDLVIAAATRGPRPQRSLRIHLFREGEVCFEPTPDFVYPLLPGVVAFAVGDVERAKGKEIVLFTARGAWSWRPGAGEKEAERRLLSGDFLWQLPDPTEAFHFWGGVRDLDGDGLDDLVFPEPGGYRIAIQRRDGDGPSSFALVGASRVPPSFGELEPTSKGAQRMKARRRARELRLSIRLGGDSKDPGESEISVLDTVPVPFFSDWDADGRSDLVALSGESLYIWRQREDGGFDRLPDVAQEFPIEMDKGRRFDISFGAYSGDLNRDGRVDCVIIAGDRRSDDIRTQILVYLNGVGKGKTAETPLFGPKGQPQQVLLVSGIVGAVALEDVDGNGEPDLVLGTVQIDTLDAIRAASSGKIEASLRVYLNQRGRLSRQPDLDYTVQIGAEDIQEAGRRLQARFIPDITGDGVRELLVRDGPTRFSVHLVRKTKDGLTVMKRPLDEHQIRKRAEIDVVWRTDGPPAIVVREGKQVHHVRYER
jgi:hypothetical protein